MTAWFNMNVHFYSDSNVPARSHRFKSSTFNSLFSHYPGLTQRSAHGFFTGFSRLLGLEPSQKMSTPLMSTLPRQGTIKMLHSTISTVGINEIGGPGWGNNIHHLQEIVMGFVCLERLCLKEPAHPSSSSTSVRANILKLLF